MSTVIDPPRVDTAITTGGHLPDGEYCHIITTGGRVKCTGQPMTARQRMMLHTASESCGLPLCPACG